MQLSIIIVNWNTRDFLVECLFSISQAIPAATARIEVFVVDNGSTDGSQSLVKEQFPWVKLIANSENIGFARANNQALRQASGEYLLLLNSDTVVHAGALDNLIIAIETQPKAGAAGPKVLNPDGTLQACYGSLPSVFSEIIGPYAFDALTKPWGRIGAYWQHQAVSDNEVRVVERVSFACTLIRREALTKVGLLDERFVFYSEDYDWFHRLRRAGWQAIYCPQAVITHHWGGSSKMRSEWAERQLYRSKRLYYRKHNGSLGEWVLRCGLSARFLGKVLASYFRLGNAPPARHTWRERQYKLLADLIRPITK